jgi:hypothetical protein
MNEAVLRKNAMQLLVEKFGSIETERFIASIIKEPFDYTEWQRDLYKGMSVDDIVSYAVSQKRTQ